MGLLLPEMKAKVNRKIMIFLIFPLGMFYRDRGKQRVSDGRKKEIFSFWFVFHCFFRKGEAIIKPFGQKSQTRWKRAVAAVSLILNQGRGL